MKKFKKLAVLVVIMGILGTAVAAFAATGSTPAEVLSGLTGESVDVLYAERSEGETFGALANEEGVLDEFKSGMFDAKKARLDQLVKEGRLTQEEADEILSVMEERIASCDGTGSGFGGGCTLGGGKGFGMGQGAGMGRGRGAGGMGQGGGFRR